MKLTWLGHSCFLLEHEGYRVLLDPYTGVEGYPPFPLTASRAVPGIGLRRTPDGSVRLPVHKVLCSHGHADHHAVEWTDLLPEAPCPFSIRTVETFHDDQGGALRGKNTIHILSVDGLAAAHLGDLGHPLTKEQAEAVGHVNALLVPVGGYYTIGAREAKAVCEALNPDFIVPMHYRHGRYGYPVLAEVEGFLSLWPEKQVLRLAGPALDVDCGLSGVLVPHFCEEN